MIASIDKLKRMKARLSNDAATEIEVPYEVVCECGETVTGIRRDTWIEAECQDCYQSLFVLPTNVYPATPSVPSEVLGGTFSERLKVVISEIFPGRRTEERPAEPKPEKADQPEKPDVAESSVAEPEPVAE